MASPFAVFRKYQAAMLAVFGVLIIIVFTIGDPLSQMVGGGDGDAENPVVVKWKGVELTRSALFSVRDMRGVVFTILTRAQRFAIANGAFGQDAEMRLRFGMPMPVQPIISEASLTLGDTVRTLLMAQKAREMGFVVTDTEINEYLSSLIDRKLSAEKLTEVLEGRQVDEDGEMGPRHYSVSAVYDVLREVMLANKMFAQFYRGSLAPPMGQQLDYYARLNRTVQAEVLAIPVDGFLKDVADPSDEQLEPYFEKYKSTVRPLHLVAGQPLLSPLPGFKLPYRVAIEYVKSNPDDWMEAVRDEVTDEEILAYYEENKVSDERLHADDDLPLPGVDEAGPGDEAGKGDDGGAGDAAGPDDDGGASDIGSDVQELAGEEGASNTAPLQPAAVQDSDRKDAAGNDAAPGDAATGDAGETTTTDAATTDAATTDAAPTDAAPTDAASTDAGATGESSSEPSPKTGGGDATGVGKGQKSEVRFKPLSEVRDYIHQKLARQKADERASSKLAAVRSRMESYYQALVYVDKGEEPAVPRPDLKALAEKEGLVWKQYGLMSGRQLSEEIAIGKSYKDLPASIQNPRPSTQPFVAIVAREGEQSLFSPGETHDDEDNRYLFWKTEEAATEVPSLDQVRDEVVRFWKLGAGLDDDSDKARGIARRHAEQLAADARAGKPLAEISVQMPGSKLIETDSFSWLTASQGNPWQSPPPQLSRVAGIEQPGPDFMRTVFSLDMNDVGVAMNYPRSYVYLVRPLRENKSREVVQDNFLAELNDRQVEQQIQSVAQLEWRQIQQDWLDQLEDDLQVVWLDPDLQYAR